MDLHAYAHKPTVLVVDDTPDNLQFMGGILQADFKVKVANSGERALRLVQGEQPPDIILLDVTMPGLDGYQVCERLKADPATAAIPVIFLTARNEVEDETRGFECGAVDYITKPFVAAVVLARVKAQIGLKRMADFLRDQKDFLEQEVARRTRELSAIQDVTILAMASLAETRDNDTGNHIRRTQHYVLALARHLQKDPRFAPQLSEHTIEMLFKSAPLHDIGKVGIPDRILLKPERLTADEFEVMKTHTTLGRDAIQHAEDTLGLEVEFLRVAKEIAYCHQEKWDGSGYPNGLQGERIPLSARMMAVADVYDALISTRVYKTGLSHEQAVRLILDSRGRHFDPDVADAFEAVAETFRAIALRFADEDMPTA
jgi:putative two-component system response regulator